MERLDFELSHFIRIAWVSDIAREVWEPRFHQITKAWQEIETLSVAEGVRPCAAMSIPPQELITLAEKCAKAGLVALPLGNQSNQNYSYTNENLGRKSDEQFLLKIVVGASDKVLDFKNSIEIAVDPESMGELLGYPLCCRQFLRGVLEKGLADTIWPMAIATSGSSNGERCIEVASDPPLNILWHWSGIRAIPHFPCSLYCKESLNTAKNYLDIGRKAKYGDEIEWLLEILSWPVQWSALHGIAEIKTPILKIATKTDATPARYIVKYLADKYPDEGASGLSFPYRVTQSSRIVESKGYQEGLNNLTLNASKSSEKNEWSILQEEWYYKDNGFQSRVGMDSTHKVVEELAITTLHKGYFDVLDLGCGNGALLKKIQGACPTVIPWGIDKDMDKIEHARVLLPKFSSNFVKGKLINFDTLLPEYKHYALAMLALSRLEEMNASEVVRFAKCIQECCDYLIVYDYWNRDIEKVALRVGVRLISPTRGSKTCLATFGTKEEILAAKMGRPKPGNQRHIIEPHDDSSYSDHTDHGDSSHGDHSDHGDSY